MRVVTVESEFWFLFRQSKIENLKSKIVGGESWLIAP